MSVSVDTAQEEKQRTFVEHLEQRALWISMAAALLQGFLTLIFNAGSGGMPLTGSPDSVAIRALVSAVLITLIVGPLAYLRGGEARNRYVPDEFRHDYRISVVPVTLAGMMLSGLTVAWVFALLDRGFPEATLSVPSSMLYLGLIAGVVAYTVASYMGQLRAAGMLYLVVGALMGTLIFAGARNEDPYWWEYSFSHLGMSASNSRTLFNIGLIFTGLLMIVWQQFFIKDMSVLVRRGLITQRVHQIFHWALIVAGIALAMVGIVRFGIGPFFNIVHDLSATGLGVVIGLLALGMWKLNRHYVREFYYMSVLMVGGIVLAAIFKVLGYVSLTGLEMIGFMLASAWLLMFLRNTEMLIQRVAPELHSWSVTDLQGAELSDKDGQES